MLKLETRFSLLLCLLCFLFACGDSKRKELREKRMLYKEHSMKQAHPEEYIYVWNAARDSIKKWANNRLGYNTIYADHTWYLDSLISFNKKVDRCVMAVSYQDDYWSPSDGMDYFYGAKIKGIWYFFFWGGHFVLPRDYYQSDVHQPLSLEKFNDLAMKNIFRGYLKKNSKDEWEINDAFFTYQLEDAG